MSNLASFPDHQIIRKILMEDVNLPYSEWKEKVDKPINPILRKINKSVQNLVPSLQKNSIYKRSTKESIQGRLRNSRIQWKYTNPNLSFHKDVDVFVQFSDYREDKKGSIFWGIEWWGASKEAEPVYHFFRIVNNGDNVTKDDGGPGAGGTSIMLVLKKYTADQLLNFGRDIIEIIAEDIKDLVQKMDGISNEDMSIAINRENSIDYLPNRDDFQKAYKTIARQGEYIPIDKVLDQIKIDATILGHKLKNNWKEITERNIENWSKMK